MPEYMRVYKSCICLSL